MQSVSRLRYALVAICLIGFYSADLQAAPANTSSGLTATISSITGSGRVVSAQFTITNTSQFRQYFYVISGSDGSAALSSGEIMVINRTSGAKTCGNNFSDCIKSYAYPELKDHNNLTYIEPGDSTVFTVQYSINGAQVGSTDTVSMPLILAVRTSQTSSATDAIDRPPGPLHIVHFNFPRVAVPIK